MLFFLALAYWLLCLRLRVQIDVSVADGQGSVAFCVGVGRVSWRRMAAIKRKKQGIGLTLVPQGESKSSGKNQTIHRVVQRALQQYLRGVICRRDFVCLALDVRVGLDDACETAVAAGAVHAIAAALFAAAAKPQACMLRVTPDFSSVCFCAHGRSIFFCQLGDIMLAALTAARRKRKEGLKWTSIPLKA